MNKSHLVEEVAKIVGARTEALKVVERIFGAMREALRNGDKIVVQGFGSFHVVLRRAKKGRNIKAGTTVTIPPRRAVKFKAAKGLL